MSKPPHVTMNPRTGYGCNHAHSISLIHLAFVPSNNRSLTFDIVQLLQINNLSTFKIIIKELLTKLFLKKSRFIR